MFRAKSTRWLGFGLIVMFAVVSIPTPVHAIWARTTANISLSANPVAAGNIAEYQVTGFEDDQSFENDEIFSFALGGAGLDQGLGSASVSNTTQANAHRWFAAEVPSSNVLQELRKITGETGENPGSNSSVRYPISASSMTEGSQITLQTGGGSLFEDQFIQNKPGNSDNREFTDRIVHLMESQTTATALIFFEEDVNEDDIPTDPIIATVMTIDEVSVTVDFVDSSGIMEFPGGGTMVEGFNAWQSVRLTLGDQGPVIQGTYGINEDGELDATGDISINEDGQVVIGKIFDTPIEISSTDPVEGMSFVRITLQTAGFLQDNESVFRLIPEPTSALLIMLPLAGAMFNRRRIA